MISEINKQTFRQPFKGLLQYKVACLLLLGSGESIEVNEEY